ncbi:MULTISPECIES: hypothetical protein [unclassified Sinorhizobium]|uniref:hypothetical protein n=1 Tax=unclassified Sinorhizobium TaxID=2613772 RepID=UPI0035264D07
MAGKAVHNSPKGDVTLFQQRLFAAFPAGERNGLHLQNRSDIGKMHPLEKAVTDRRTGDAFVETGECDAGVRDGPQ